MNEIMAEIVQLGLQDTKAINLRAAASSSPYLTSPFCHRQAAACAGAPAQLPALLCLPHIFIFFKPDGTKTEGTLCCFHKSFVQFKGRNNVVNLLIGVF